MLFILGRYKQDFFSKFIKTVMSDFILSSFDSEINFKIAMLSLYQSLGTVNNSSQIANNRRVVR
jgi:hypothetical protein